MRGHDYGLVDRLLHRLALGTPALAELSFDLDQKASGAAASSAKIAQGRHVFVTGLARAGTTILLRHLHDSGAFRSLTYRDMPFALAPGLWKRFSGRWHRQRAAQMRAHGDGIIVDADSPEALEEIFWRIHCGEDYIHANGLSPHHPDAHDLLLFQRYVAAIIASGEPGQTRYLSKNNNNILRLPALRTAFPQAAFVIPFRHPAAHALSLWRQHLHFCEMQQESPFVRSYMDWLVHHEFGLGHRPFLIGGPPPSNLSPHVPDYWLDLWTRVHLGLIHDAREGCHFVCYEDLCTDLRVWPHLTEKLGLATGGGPHSFILKSGRSQDRSNPARLGRAEAIYADLRQRAAIETSPRAAALL